MISYLLLYKILQLAIIMVFGFLLVKFKIVKSPDSTVLSKISLWILMPAAIINSFDVEMTPDIVSGLILAFVFATLIHILLLVIDALYKKLFKGTSVERASIVYSNAANLIIPIVAYVLGEEWVIYTCAFLSVQLVFLWTHGICLFSSEKKINIRKILLNINIIAILLGFLMMTAGLRLPKFAKEISSSLGSMLGIVAMIIAGMLAAEVNFKKMAVNKRLYLVLVMRMIICPIAILVLIKSCGFILPVINAKKVLLISFLATITPSATTVMQFAQLNNKDADFAVAVNILTTIVCIVTMPVFAAIYQL